MQKLPRDFQVFVIGTIFSGLVLMWVLLPQVMWDAWPELLLFLVLITLASLFAVPNPRGGVISATPQLLYVLFTVQGPGAAILIGGSAYAVGSAISRGWVPWRTLFNGAQVGISAAIGGLVFRALGGTLDRIDILSFFLPFTFGALAHQMMNNFFVTFLLTRLEKSALLPVWLSEMADYLWQDGLSIPSAALLAILYVSVHPGVLVLYVASLPLQTWALQLYLQQKKTFTQAIDSLVSAIDADFPEGKGHSRHVAETAVAIGRNLSLSEQDLEGIEMAALLHDIGMIGLYDHTKSPEESESPDELREHVQLGANLARRLPRRGHAIAEIILSHHEGYDGSGYPHGLRGTQIPLGARIVAVAEVYETMLASGAAIGTRPSPADVATFIKERSGKTFDPLVVKAFMSAIDEGRIVPGTRPIGDPTMRTSGIGRTG